MQFWYSLWLSRLDISIHSSKGHLNNLLLLMASLLVNYHKNQLIIKKKFTVPYFLPNQTNNITINTTTVLQVKNAKLLFEISTDVR